MSEPIWVPSYDFACQSAHLFAGMTVILVVRPLCQKLRIYPLYAYLVLETVLVTKELLVDVYMEQSCISAEIVDVLFYNVGGVIGSLLHRVLR